MLLKCRRRRSALARSLPAPWTASGGRTSPELHIVSSAIAHHGRAKDRQVLLHLPVSLSARQTAHRRLSVAYHDRSQSHRQWLAVTAPAGRADVVERVRPTCRGAARCCQTKRVPKKGVEGRKREAAKKAEEATIHRSSSKRLSPTPLHYPLEGTHLPRFSVPTRHCGPRCREQIHNACDTTRPATRGRTS